ncbi:MAG: glycosyltransferase [Candidatus Omnitrophica bacterium]|nr:glycosyltransferase [Candidatus Omnitrophota bacterium]MBU4589479.1 glycosyltransferase [Candidatus Omnitrophota bacterium]
MKIALYYPWIYLKSGVEKTILELVKRSSHQWTIFTSHYDPGSTYPEIKNLNIVELPRISVKRSFVSVFLAGLKICMQKIDLRDFDALVVFSEGLGDFIAFRNHDIPTICYCWTPLKVLHDPFARKAYLKTHKIKTPLFLLFGWLFSIIDRISWRYYNDVICCSNEIKQRIVKAGLCGPAKIKIISPGVDIEKIRPAWTYNPYFFHPTRIKWWKNVGLSIDAFKEFQNICGPSDFKLIIAGQVDRGSRRYYERVADRCRENTHIQILPNPPEKDLAELYKNSYAVLNTTLNEDWGLIPLEAMAYGKPIIAVNQGGPKESIIDKMTGFLAEPTPSGFAEAMKILAEDKDLALSIGRSARKHSLKYDWSDFVKRIDACLDLNN